MIPSRHDLTVEYVPVGELRTYHRNPRRGDTKALARSLEVNGQYKPVVVNVGTHTGRPMEVLAGNHTLIAARDLGWSAVAVVTVDVDDDQAGRIVVADNRTADLGDYDDRLLLELLADLPDLDGTGYDPGDFSEMERLLNGSDPGGGKDHADGLSLVERFGIPPFTVLDSRQGYWHERKKSWISLGISSELGREKDLISSGGMASAAKSKSECDGNKLSDSGWAAGTSIFDPVLAELLIRWYSAPGHRVLDPFAGGSVRGLVSYHLGRQYTGIDLREEQVTANNEQLASWMESPSGDDVTPPAWVVGDARDIREIIAATDRADLLLTCPPYYDLEIYGDDPADLSRAHDYTTFLKDYEDCLSAATDRMKSDSFAAIVTGAVRDKNGAVLDLPGHTTRIMEKLGWCLYQDAVLLTPVGTVAFRAGRQFTALRKLARVHQMVGIYHRGNINLVRTWPPAEFGDEVTDGVTGHDPDAIDEV